MSAKEHALRWLVMPLRLRTALSYYRRPLTQLFRWAIHFTGAHQLFLYGTDINPQAGYLLQPPYDRAGKVLYGDSIESLSRLDATIDVFINDSDHSTDYEMREYDAVAAKLSPRAIVIGDNSHFSDKLIEFATRTDRDFLFFQEQPADHWYPGGGIGAAYIRRQGESNATTK